MKWIIALTVVLLVSQSHAQESANPFDVQVSVTAVEGAVYYLNRFSGIAVGVYFVGIIYYIVTNAIIPITQAGEWRTVIDVIAVSTYVIAGLPLI